MRAIKLTSIFLLFLNLVSYAAIDLFDDISAAIRTGDVHTISSYFGTNVDLTIINREEMYSKAQAEQLLKDFFSKNNPVSFNIIHTGVSKEGSKYAIGTLTTSQGAIYRTYFYIKQNGSSYYIQELRFMLE